jgi:polysaccharide pyruvyl transferase WcaK-like protein
MYASGMVLNFGRVGTRNFFGYTLRNAMPLLMARALGIPYGINGHSFEAIEWPADLVHRPLLKDARFISCRDPDSIDYLRQRDLLSPRTTFGPDSTFFYTGTDEAWARQFMRENALSAGRFITVTVRDAVSQAGSLAHVIPIEREREQMARMREFIENWIKRTGVPVVLCPESKREVRWHHDNIHLLLSPEAKAKCVLTHTDLSSFWNAGKAGALYQQAEMIVSMEMHSVIMGLSRGTPTLMIQFLETGRKASMLQELGLGDWLFDVDEPNSGAKLLEAALKIHADRPTAEARVRSQLPRLKSLGLAVVEDIKTNWRK